MFLDKIVLMKILVVEDDRSLGTLLKIRIEEYFKNVMVEHVVSAEQAEAWLSQNKPRIAIVDINLPWKSGVILAGIIKKLYPDAGIIMITGMDHVTSEELEKYSLVGFLKKPFEIKQLIQIMENFLEKKGKELKLSNIVDILQLYEVEKRKVCIEVKRTDKRGRIYMENGKILHAEIGGVEGRKALKEIITLGSEEVDIKKEESSKKTIDEPVSSLLVDILEDIEKEEKANQ